MSNGPVVCNTVLCGECFITLITLISKNIRKMLGLHVISDVSSSGVGEGITKLTGVLASQRVPLNIL